MKEEKPILTRCSCCGGMSEESSIVTKWVNDREELLAKLKCIEEFGEAEGSPFALSVAKTARAAIAKATEAQ